MSRDTSPYKEDLHIRSERSSSYEVEYPHGV
ncbi:hypothetical protein PIIN_09520 [Serendipita indica DSM 11827]|uniref:Uncharacterized protein n=1 Tax=Serendipita indica (strain DSM 11827) TaxID=1109443 RepID=G4U347_SERID|nr:hypothetical protein PIIN_09520 [Serendipita indica DSM 11827]